MTLRTIYRYALLSLLLVASAFPQNRFQPLYHVIKTTTMSGTPEVVSVVNPQSDGRQLNIKNVFVKCSAACDFQIEMDGTAPGGTNLTSSIVKATKRLGASNAQAFAASTTTTPRFSIPYSLPSQGTYPMDFTGYSLPGDGTNSNFTVRMLTSTGVTVTIFIQLEEP